MTRKNANAIGEKIVSLYRQLESTDEMSPKTARIWNQIRRAEAEFDAAYA